MKASLVGLCLSSFFLFNTISLKAMEIAEESTTTKISPQSPLKIPKKRVQQDSVRQDGTEKKKKTFVPNLNLKASHFSDTFNKVSGRSDKADVQVNLPPDRVQGKFNPSTADDLLMLVKMQSQHKNLPKRTRVVPPSPNIVIEDEDPLADIIMHPSQEFFEEENRKFAKQMKDNIHIRPEVLLEAQYRLRGEPDKTPREFEKAKWKELKDSKPEKYDRLVEDLFLLMLDRIEKTAEPKMSDDDEEKDKFVDTHVGILNRHIDDQEGTIARKDFYMKILGLLSTIISTGFGAWATYAQISCGGSGGTNTTAV